MDGGAETVTDQARQLRARVWRVRLEAVVAATRPTRSSPIAT